MLAVDEKEVKAAGAAGMGAGCTVLCLSRGAFEVSLKAAGRGWPVLVTRPPFDLIQWVAMCRYSCRCCVAGVRTC